jgi:transposase
MFLIVEKWLILTFGEHCLIAVERYTPESDARKLFHLFRRMMAMETSPFLPLPEGMLIGQVELTAAQLTVEVISTQPFAHCPGCGSPSDHVHCHYQRTVHDVPCGGRHIVLRRRGE